MNVGCFTDCFTIGSTTTTLWCVNDKGDVTASDEIDCSDFGAFAHFADNRINHVTEPTQIISGARSRNNAKAKRA